MDKKQNFPSSAISEKKKKKNPSQIFCNAVSFTPRFSDTGTATPVCSVLEY